jgi:hypothetical protein
LTEIIHTAAAFPELALNRQRGSKPRCHLLTHGPRPEIASRLSDLISPWGVVRESDFWMPQGFELCEEAQLHLAATLLPKSLQRDSIRDWWLARPGRKVQTPNFDLASTCLIKGREGLLLVEAKAHNKELSAEEGGKKLTAAASADSVRNHFQIGGAIQLANMDLSRDTGLAWSLSRDLRYQMSNRFASAWKLTELGKPVILMYLGFTGCEEMRGGKAQHPISSAAQWHELVFAHSAVLFPDDVWNREWTVNGQPFIPVCRATNQELIRD